MNHRRFTSAEIDFPMGSRIVYSCVTGTCGKTVTGCTVGFHSVNVNYEGNKKTYGVLSEYTVSSLTWSCPSMGKHSLMFVYGQRN